MATIQNIQTIIENLQFLWEDLGDIRHHLSNGPAPAKASTATATTAPQYNQEHWTHHHHLYASHKSNYLFSTRTLASDLDFGICFRRQSTISLIFRRWKARKPDIVFHSSSKTAPVVISHCYYWCRAPCQHSNLHINCCLATASYIHCR